MFKKEQDSIHNRITKIERQITELMLDKAIRKRQIHIEDVEIWIAINKLREKTEEKKEVKKEEKKKE